MGVDQSATIEQQPGQSSLPGNRDPAAWVVGLLALTLFLAPAVGATTERLLQDTLKSMIVSFGVLLAALLWCWSMARSAEPPRWHALLWLPIGLMLYAFGSMAWSHTYLAAVEAIRWFIFGLLLWVGLNTLRREYLPILIAGIHWGAVMASLWAALQFWADLKLFPQGPNPASTFINRNFFAEYAVCTLPFSAWLVAQSKDWQTIVTRVSTSSVTLVAVLMTGTRSALVALIVLVLLLPWTLYCYRDELGLRRWSRRTSLATLALLLLGVAGMGVIETGNQTIRSEMRGNTPLGRALIRATSMMEPAEYSERSFSARLVMWKSTLRMVLDRPIAGVGAGAWEVEIPRYQSASASVEDDFYAHNDIVQILAEYGLVGWVLLLCLLAYLSWTACTLWPGTHRSHRPLDPIRAVSLCSVLAFLLVSNAGFPWRLASSGALFSLNLAILAASDAESRHRRNQHVVPKALNSIQTKSLMVLLVVSMAFAAFLSFEAIRAERKLVHAAQLALSITRSGVPNDPRWALTKEKMLALVDEGIAINPHYRKVTPIVADELARWGDWQNAVWIWESVIASRPYIVAILTNIGRGYAQMGHLDRAQVYLNRARTIQPEALSVKSLEVMILIRSDRADDAARLIQQDFTLNRYDIDLLNSAYLLGIHTKNWTMAIEALQRRNQRWPQYAIDGWLQIGNLYASSEVNEPQSALEAYRQALALAPPTQKPHVRQFVAEAYRDSL